MIGLGGYLGQNRVKNYQNDCFFKGKKGGFLVPFYKIRLIFKNTAPPPCFLMGGTRKGYSIDNLLKFNIFIMWGWGVLPSLLNVWGGGAFLPFLKCIF